MKKAMLALADGRVFAGRSFGAEGETAGEIIFNTSMMGYQEILTDPSYEGQIVTMTYPLIGNVGVNPEDTESGRPYAAGFVVKEGSRISSNWRSEGSLHAYLADHGIVGIQGVDTRALTRHIRDCGAQQGIISTVDLDRNSLAARAGKLPSMAGQDLVSKVTCREAYDWQEAEWDLETGYRSAPTARFHVAVFDFGIKRNILRILSGLGCRLTVLPATTSSAEVRALSPDGIFLSNGPGDPEPVTYAVETIRELIGVKPIFGICLGHQLLGRALGGKTYKLKFGHHGGNQPVMDLSTRKVEITSQNHGFAVDVESLQSAGGEVELTHINLNDRTVEGLRHRTYSAFSVQYHPESSPGPHDSRYLFGRFLEMMEQK
ncbi:MAG: glutamine-hydrolyzing carbamoyl-phosphate synthase small subunit [Deltaproteobacteria bacterium]|nr:glutamine-hydrolyzing carbamoyl-phosphate synthase small subunit [Deltaproteobacteria bacterium]